MYDAVRLHPDGSHIVPLMITPSPPDGLLLPGIALAFGAGSLSAFYRGFFLLWGFRFLGFNALGLSMLFALGFQGCSLILGGCVFFQGRRVAVFRSSALKLSDCGVVVVNVGASGDKWSLETLLTRSSLVVQLSPSFLVFLTAATSRGRHFHIRHPPRRQGSPSKPQGRIPSSSKSVFWPF